MGEVLAVEPGGEFEPTCRELPVSPSLFVPDPVVVPAVGVEAVGAGEAGLGEIVLMIEVAVFGGHAASGEDAAPVQGFYPE